MTTFSRAQTVVALIANERRAFVARYLLDETPQPPVDLMDRLSKHYPHVAVELAPWPSTNQRLASICRRSLSSLGLADSIETTVYAGDGGHTPVQADAWHATDLLRELSDFIDFSFELSTVLGISNSHWLDYYHGTNLLAPHNRAQTLVDLANKSAPDKPVRVTELTPGGTNEYPAGTKKHAEVHKHVKALTSVGFANIMPGSRKDISRVSYYWTSDDTPDEELATRLGLEFHREALKVMQILHSETAKDGTTTLFADYLLERVEYQSTAILKILNRLIKSGIANRTSQHGLVEVTITPEGLDGAKLFAKPLIKALDGDQPSRDYVRSQAESFRQRGIEGQVQVMRRYATVPKNY